MRVLTVWLPIGTLGLLLAPQAGASVLSVGAGQPFSTLAAAVAAASAGDTVEVMPGTYTNQVADITVPLTIAGVGAPGSVVFTATAQLANDKGFLLIDASTTVDNLTFQNATADTGSNNGAGIRYQSGNLTVLNSHFVNNQDGILATPATSGTGSVVIRNSVFLGNGVADGLPGAGFAHAIYANDLALLDITGSSFDGTQQGHDIKSRALNSIIAGNSINDGVTGDSSYAIDLPNGGDASIIGNTINQGDNSPNWTMIAYGEEGLTYGSNNALIDGNIFNNTQPIAYGIDNFISDPQATNITVSCNAFNTVSDPAVGPVTFTGNVINGALPACAMTRADVPAPKGPAAVLPGLLAILALRWHRGRTAAPVPAPN